MEQKHIQNKINLEEIKAVKEQLKESYKTAKMNEEEKKATGEEIEKQPLGQKIIGIIILILLIVGVAFAFISNLDTVFLPKNSVTITVTDQYGNCVPGLEIFINSANHSFWVDYSEDSTPSVTNLNVKPGKYSVLFSVIPDGYTFTKNNDNFTLEQDGKVKLEYEFIKEN